MTIVKFMNDNPTAKIVVAGHSSHEGAEDYNSQLSEKRMKELVDFLIEKGVSADRIIGEFHGETKPRVECGSKCSEKDHANNRRTEIKVVK
jgi:outer membrane protein OmpA-like peptidoglycan-associated protein